MKDLIIRLLHEVADEFLRRQINEPSEIPEFDLSISKDVSHGDFASNLAFKLAKNCRKSPKTLAEEIMPLIKSRLNSAPYEGVIAKVEAAGAGFINIYLAKDSIAQILKKVFSENESFGRTQYGSGQKVLLEFVSANPTGPLTIAHGRQAAIGDSLKRILQFSGYHADAEYYLNDGGRQMNLLGKSLLARYFQICDLEKPLPEDGYQGEYLLDVARQLLDQHGRGLLVAPEKDAEDFCRRFAGDTIMKGIVRDLQDADVRFDSYFSEQALYENKIDQVLQLLRESGFLYEKDGALWFESTRLGDDKDRVVRKSTGEYTYLAPDIAYHHEKFRRGYDRLINLLGPDHHGYVARLNAACRALGHNDGVLNVLIVQLTTLFRKGQPVRMSTRAGEFVTLRELMDEVGKDATRFFFVSRKIETHLDFDLDLAKAKSQDNPVFYLQYAHARIASLLKFSGQEVSLDIDSALFRSDEERGLIKKIAEFPDVLVSACEHLEPYRLADYLMELAACFHKFYSAHRIVTDDAAMTKARLLLAASTRIVLRNGLSLLGVSQPESM